MTQHDEQARLRDMLDYAQEAVDLDIFWDSLRINLLPLIAGLRSILGQDG
jgi:hypothetical protein